MIHGDLRDGLIRRIGYRERATRLVHAPEPEISMQAHPQSLDAVEAECAVRHPCGAANLGHVKRLVAVRLQKLLEPRMTGTRLP
jgi:hypothetical protein